jgi:hypothetical protein
VRKVENAGHHFISSNYVVRVKGVDDALLRLTVWAAAGNTAQHEETEVVVVDGNGAINQLACVVVVVKGLAHIVDIVTE